ncbi:MAG: hypothetical protein PHG82_02390, partial [Candidatus Gracilibacteria bacterium]|nr:hypothetical protein [Candidatus Gracilibacteria bacterium]
YIANIPSLLWNNSGSVDLLNTSTKYVVNKKTNLPYKINSTSDIGTKDANTIIQEITGTGVATLTGVNITNINSSNIGTTFSGVLLASFGGDISKLTNNVIGGAVASVPTVSYTPLSATGGTITSYSTGGITYKIHTFSSPGIYNFSILSGNGTIEVYVAGAGGGGGGLGTYWGAGDGTSGNNIGGNGGYGGASAKQISSSLLTGQITINVGSGGTGGASGYNYPTPVYGGTGGSSSFGNFLSASGGSGGSSYGGIGATGSGSGGDVNGGLNVSLPVSRSIPPINSINGGLRGTGSSMATGGGAGGTGGNGTVIVIYQQ